MLDNGFAQILLNDGVEQLEFILTDGDGEIYDFRNPRSPANWQLSESETVRGSGDVGDNSDIATIPPSKIPASDRVVALDHNSEAYRTTLESIDAVIVAVEQSNEYDDAEDKEETLAELSAGLRLLEAARVRVQAAWIVLRVPLEWLGQKFAEGIVGELARHALDLVTRLIGF